MEYTVSLSSTQNKALGYVAMSQNDWIQNAVRERCRLAVNDIVQTAVEKCVATQTPIPATQEEIVELAFTNGWVKTMAQKAEEMQQSIGA